MNLSDAAVQASLIGVGGVVVGIVISAMITWGGQAWKNHYGRCQVRAITRALFRNAFLQLDRSMLLEYVDDEGAFEQTLRMVVERASRDDIVDAFGEKRADDILAAIPQLLGAIHSGLQASRVYTSDDLTAKEMQTCKDLMSASLGAALSKVVLVLNATGDEGFAKSNVAEINMHRVLKFLDDAKEDRKLLDERAQKMIEEMRYPSEP